MAWSTREIAELAGTSLRTVRHYHEVGLLAEPERRSNGYKRYGVEHLVRLLRIKRLTELGFSLPQIAEMGDADEHPEQALRLLDAEVASTIERLQRVRAELALILSKSAPTDLPPELATVNANSNLSDADRKFMVVLSRLLSPAAIAAHKDMLSGYEADATGRDFDNLPPDADEQTRADLARRMVPVVRGLRADNPGLTELNDKAAKDKKFAAHTVNSALVDLYNSAQLDVMRRMNTLLAAQSESD